MGIRPCPFGNCRAEQAEQGCRASACVYREYVGVVRRALCAARLHSRPPERCHGARLTGNVPARLEQSLRSRRIPGKGLLATGFLLIVRVFQAGNREEIALNG